MRSTREARQSATQPIAPENVKVIASATPDPMALYAVEGPGKYRHE